jgi:hypothetical protein
LDELVVELRDYVFGLLGEDAFEFVLVPPRLAE